jgi:cell division protein FtsB
MAIGNWAKRTARAAAPPFVFLTLTAYFCWSATQGDRGLIAYAQRQEQLKAVQIELARAEADRDGWERRVAGLRSNRLDTDAVDERARAMLNLADPSDLVVLWPAGKKLF